MQTASPEIAFEQRRVLSNVDCRGCGAHLIENGILTCPRCREHIQMASSQDVKIDSQGRWQCQKCKGFGKRPKTLACQDEILCRFCKTKTQIFQQGEEMVTKQVETKNHMTTAEFRDLLKKERKRAAVALAALEEGTPEYERAQATVQKFAEAYEDFDPDAIERELNVPVRTIGTTFFFSIDRVSTQAQVFGPKAIRIDCAFNPFTRSARITVYALAVNMPQVTYTLQQMYIERVERVVIDGRVDSRSINFHLTQGVTKRVEIKGNLYGDLFPRIWM